MRAIPERLLVHSCVLRKPTVLDRDRNAEYAETVLRRVRIGATLQTTRNSVGEAKSDTMTLIIDAKNTRYETADGGEASAAIPEEGDAVEWQGMSFTVRSVTPCHAQSDAPHHWEVTLE